jgi:serine/threonine-protein kinase HipA
LRRDLDVFLGGILVGRLTENDGRISFRIADEYRRLSDRPVLSQSFEDDLEKVYRGKRGQLPIFFANLIPEGPLRELIEKSLQIPHGDEMALLEAVGGDLPGAVEIRPGLEETELADESDLDDQSTPLPNAPSEDGLLRFSLAGVQLKFSVLREGEKLTLPVQGQSGDWIVKIDSSRFPHVVENEFAMLEWARAAGFEVPECHLEPSKALASVLRVHASSDRNVLVIRRYDREGARRIHQEDFAQVVGLPPELKYDHVTYEQLARLVKGIAGPDAYLEFVRRLAFMVASGNTDGHLKNWSLVYPDGVRGVLSPLYDQVCTIAWPELKPELALKFAGSKNLMQVDERSFERLAVRAGDDADRTVSTLHESLERIASAWRESAVSRIMPPDHVTALQDYWSRSPLLRRWVAEMRR